MFGSKYRATLKYKTHNSFIISRKNNIRVVMYDLFNDINQEYNVEIIKYKVNESTTYFKKIYKIDKHALSYEIIIESLKRSKL